VADAVTLRQILDDEPRTEREIAGNDVVAQLVLDAIDAVAKCGGRVGFDRLPPSSAMPSELYPPIGVALY
jgi:hypothetical protein